MSFKLKASRDLADLIVSQFPVFWKATSYHEKSGDCQPLYAYSFLQMRQIAFDMSRLSFVGMGGPSPILRKPKYFQTLVDLVFCPGYPLLSVRHFEEDKKSQTDKFEGF